MADLAEMMKAAEGDKYYVRRHLIIYHLRQASKLSKELAESMQQDQRVGNIP